MGIKAYPLANLFFVSALSTLSHCRNYLDGILEGYLTLIDISLPQQGGLVPHPSSNATNSYQGVKASFCHIAWNLQQRNPSQVPLFRDLEEESPLCAATLVRDLDLYTLVQQAKAYDSHSHNFTATTPKTGHQVVSVPTAVLFHETRCGSTLISNLVASSLPEQVRSYSESTPPLAALMACDLIKVRPDPNNPTKRLPCHNESQLQLIRDVFYMMGRITRPKRPQYVFYKMQSIGARYIDLLTQALPTVKWAFAYRDSVEILMSHFKDYQRQPGGNEQYQDVGDALLSSSSSLFSWGSSGQQNNKDGHDSTSGARPVCLRSYGKTKQHPTLVNIVKERAPERNVSSLTEEEYCAAYLASLAQAAVTEHDADSGKEDTGSHASELHRKMIRPSWFLKYSKLPHAIWEDWLPAVFHVDITGPMKDRMQATANLYAKNNAINGNEQNNQMWQEDSTLKQARAPKSLKEAAKLFMNPIYKVMNEIEQGQL